jgi:hypothetical protein
VRLSITLGLAALAAAAVVPGTLQAQNTTPVAVQLPTGDYLVAVKPTDSLPEGMVGDWQVVFETGGVYRVIRNGNVRVLGEFRSVADTVYLVDKSGTMACGATAGSTYVWKGEPDGSLTLIAVKDECRGRQRLMTLRPLVKVKPQ